MSHPTNIDVAIIGGGWSGILACKYMIENGLSALSFEASDDIGGVFKYREDAKDVGGVIWSTHTTSSKTTTEMADFPMPHSFPNFPSHRQILQYLNDYIDHFQIRSYILLNTAITSSEKQGDVWVLEDAKGNRYTSKFLVVCCGVHQNPDYFYKNDERFKDIGIKTMHGAAYKKPTEDFYEKKILIYGSGETASDIASELCPIAKRVVLCIPHGQWFVNRYTRTGEHLDNTIVLDHFSSRLRRLLDPVDNAYFGQYRVEKEGGICGHGIKEWENDTPYWGQFFNKSAHILPHFIQLGALLPKGDIKKITGNEVTFQDDSKEAIDTIIFCCGYRTEFPFLKGVKDLPINERFKFCFDHEDPTLAFIGFVRPVVGSIPAISELQSLYAAKLFSKKLTLPEKPLREKIIENDKKRQAKTYSKTSNRVKGLVNFLIYTDELASLCKIRPNYGKLFLKNPKKWAAAIIAPYNNCQFLLHDLSKHEQIFDTYKNRTQDYAFSPGIIKAVLVGLFPSLFLLKKRPKPLALLLQWLNTFISLFLWILLLPLLLYRIFKNRKKNL